MEMIAIFLTAVGALSAAKFPQEALCLIAAGIVFALVSIGNQLNEIVKLMKKENSK